MASARDSFKPSRGRRRAGALIVPMRAEGPGGILGDGMVEIGPDHPQYREWEAFLHKDGLKASSGPQPS